MLRRTHEGRRAARGHAAPVGGRDGARRGAGTGPAGCGSRRVRGARAGARRHRLPDGGTLAWRSGDHRHRHSRPAARLLHGFHRGRRLEDRERRHLLDEPVGQGVRRRFHRCGGGRALGSQRHIRGNGLRRPARQHLRGQRGLPQHRRRTLLDPCGSRGRRPHRPDRGGSGRPRPGLRRRAGPDLRPLVRAGGLSDGGWREDLDGVAPDFRRDRRRGARDEPDEPAGAFRRDVAGGAEALDPHRRRPRGRALPDPGRRRVVGTGRGRVSGSLRGRPAWSYRGVHRRVGPAPGVRARHRRRGAGRPLPERRQRGHLDAGERRPPPAGPRLVLQPRGRRPDGSGHRLRAERALPEVGGRGQVLPDRPAPPRRPPRPVDQPERLPDHGGGERRGRHRDARRGRELVLHPQPAHRGVLPAHRGRRVPPAALRRAAGQFDDQRAGLDRQRPLTRGPLVGRRRRRERPHRRHPRAARTHLRGQLHRPDRPAGPRRGRRAERHRLSRTRRRNGSARPPVPLSVERPDRRFPARPGGRLPHLQLRPPNHGRRPLVDDHLARPDGGRSGERRPAGRAGAARPHRRRGLRHDLRAWGIAAGAGGDLGGQRRRPGPPDAGRRRILDRSHPAGNAGRRHREQP